MEKNQKAIFNATIRMEKDRRKKMEMGIFMITRILVRNADRQLADIGGEDKWIELNLRQLDDDLNEDHDQHCNRGEESQPGQDREWRERESWGVDRCG